MLNKALCQLTYSKNLNFTQLPELFPMYASPFSSFPYVCVAVFIIYHYKRAISHYKTVISHYKSSFYTHLAHFRVILHSFSSFYGHFSKYKPLLTPQSFGVKRERARERGPLQGIAAYNHNILTCHYDLNMTSKSKEICRYFRFFVSFRRTSVAFLFVYQIKAISYSN